MEYLQYSPTGMLCLPLTSFKPYYKWNTFNTMLKNKIGNDMIKF